MWRAAGFTDVVDTTLAIRMEFESFEDYWGPYSAKDGPRSYAALAWAVKGRAP